LTVERVWYRYNEDRLKTAAKEYTLQFPRTERIKAFSRFISESFAQESEDVKQKMKDERDDIYEEEMKAWKDRKKWDRGVNSLNK
jgi:hypothetical protein